MFKRGEIVIWTTKWGTRYLGQVIALFRDDRQVECLYAKCIDDDLVGFRFIADVDSCKLFLKTSPKVIEGRVIEP